MKKEASNGLLHFMTQHLNMDPGNDGHASEYSYISDNSYDTIDELLKRFTLEFTPEYSLKLRDTYVLNTFEYSLVLVTTAVGLFS